MFFSTSSVGYKLILALLIQRDFCFYISKCLLLGVLFIIGFVFFRGFLLQGFYDHDDYKGDCHQFHPLELFLPPGTLAPPLELCQNQEPQGIYKNNPNISGIQEILKKLERVRCIELDGDFTNFFFIFTKFLSLNFKAQT